MQHGSLVSSLPLAVFPSFLPCLVFLPFLPFFLPLDCRRCLGAILLYPQDSLPHSRKRHDVRQAVPGQEEWRFANTNRTTYLLHISRGRFLSQQGIKKGREEGRRLGFQLAKTWISNHEHLRATVRYRIPTRHHAKSFLFKCQLSQLFTYFAM